jgi:class 3 adenylate cyclase
MAKTKRTPTPFLIVFLDFTHFSAQSLRVEDSEIAETLDAYYEQVAEAIAAADGTIVKFIGDATMIVFSEDKVDIAIRTLIEVRAAADRFMADRGWECRLHAKAHFGSAIAGEFGAKGNKRFDVFGRAVNATAMLKTNGFTLSNEAYEKLSPELRRHFKEHAPSTYIHVDDPRPFSR